MRKICVLELFSQRRTESFCPPRREELGQLVRLVYDDCVAGNPVSLTLKFGHFAGNNITRMLLGKRIFETDKEGQKEASRFKVLVFEIFTLASSVKLGDFLPWLKWTTHVTGRRAKEERLNLIAEEEAERKSHEESLAPTKAQQAAIKPAPAATAPAPAVTAPAPTAGQCFFL